MNKYWLLIFIVWACANPIPPTGGPKDLDPPVLIQTVPENKTLNFQGSEIELIFDEYIKEENLLTQLMITPNIKGNYNYKVNRNRIVLSFTEPFDSTTTYTLNFREGIKDITEGNVPPNLKFVFSTGDFLDSASVRGIVRSLLSKKPLDEVTLSLYQYPDTITIFDGPPRYSTQTNEEGLFVIENIKNGTYTMFSLDDKNRNLTLESQSEGYGFLAEPLAIEDSLGTTDIFLFNLDTRPIVLQNSRPVGHHYEAKFNKSLSGYKILTENHNLFSQLIEDNQTLRIYRSDQVTDSLGLQIMVEDSLAQSLDTLLYVKFSESTRKLEDFTGRLEPGNEEVNKYWKGDLELTKPAARFNYDSIYFQFDSLYTIILSDTMFSNNYSNNSFDIEFNFRTYLVEDSIFQNWDGEFKLVFAPGSIISPENDSMKSITRTYSFKDPKDYGIIRGTISNNYRHYFLQLVDKSLEVVEEIYVSSSQPYQYEFNHIKPGTYSIRILVDENGNGVWDPGNIRTSQLPEKVYLFYNSNVGSQEINLRANWEQTGLNLDY